RARRELGRFNLAVENVLDGKARGDQVVGDDPAMAAPPDGFRAHHRGATLARELQQLLEAGAELGRVGVIGVVAETRLAPQRVRRFAARAPSLASAAQCRKM